MKIFIVFVVLILLIQSKCTVCDSSLILSNYQNNTVCSSPLLYSTFNPSLKSVYIRGHPRSGTTMLRQLVFATLDHNDLWGGDVSQIIQNWEIWGDKDKHNLLFNEQSNYFITIRNPISSMMSERFHYHNDLTANSKIDHWGNFNREWHRNWSLHTYIFQNLHNKILETNKLWNAAKIYHSHVILYEDLLTCPIQIIRNVCNTLGQTKCNIEKIIHRIDDMSKYVAPPKGQHVGQLPSYERQNLKSPPLLGTKRQLYLRSGYIAEFCAPNVLEVIDLPEIIRFIKLHMDNELATHIIPYMQC